MMTFAELRSRIREIQSTTEDTKVMGAVLEFLKDESASFDADARREHDRILDGLIAIGTENARCELPRLEDGPRRRTAARMIARTEGSHFSTFDAAEVLKGDTQQKSSVVEGAAAGFHLALQGACDLLFDARQGAAGDRHAVVLYGLLSGLVDELLVGFHLAQRAFANQAYAHVRTVHEFLDVAELLFADRNWLDKWLSATDEDAEKQVFYETRKAVRKRAAPEDERLYAFLSAAGTHAQLRGLQARAEIHEREAKFFFLGSKSQLETANVLVVRAAVSLVHKIARVFSARLDPEDVKETQRQSALALETLANSHLQAIAEQTRIPPPELREVLKIRAAPADNPAKS